MTGPSTSSTIFRNGANIDLRRSGSAAWDICLVASGVIGMFFECNLRLWDFAAAGLIAEEAGGRITDMNGEPLTYRGQSSILCTGKGVSGEIKSL